MYIDGRAYAAKCFFNLGGSESGAISNEDNLRELQKELMRQDMVRRTAAEFTRQAERHKVPIYGKDPPFTFESETIILTVWHSLGVSVDDAFVFQVNAGPREGHTWLVDPMYKDAETAIRRFSGTDEAGDHSNDDEDLAGRTCDALAHFSLFDSERAVVFVDIEGTSLCVNARLNLSLISHTGTGINTAYLPTRGRLERPKLILFDCMIHR